MLMRGKKGRHHADGATAELQADDGSISHSRDYQDILQRDQGAAYGAPQSGDDTSHAWW
jgi:hypothetical protein